MDSDIESSQDKIILFIYSQEHYRKELANLKRNEYISESKCLKEYNIGGKTHYIFYLLLKSDYDKESIELEFEKEGISYSSKIEIKEIYSEIFLFKIDFNPKENKENQLSKFTMNYLEQFKLFLKLKDEKNLGVDFSDEYLINLCLSAINFISSAEENSLTLDFLFNIFINSYLIQKKGENSQENLIKNFFDSLDIKSISSNNTDIKVQSKDDSKYKEYFSSIQNTQKELFELGGEKNLDKINIILAYYYLKNSPKNFVNLVSMKNNYSKNIFQNLKKNSKIFNDFSSEIIDFTLFNEAENMDEIEILLKLLPNMVELFKIFLDMDFFVKISNLSQIEGKCIDVLEIVSPKSTDDLDSLYNYFFVVIETCVYEGIVIFKLPDKFFLDYANFYAKKNLQNLKLIREMYEKYSSLTNINNINETINILNNLFYEAGIQLIKNEENFINEEIINFFQESRKKEIETIEPDDVCKLINLNIANEEFINNFLNNNFKKFDLKVFFGKKFDYFIQKIFENFKKLDDFCDIKNWKISPNVNEEVLKYCIRRISIVIYENKTNANNGEKTLKSSFTDLINFLCNLFSFGSRKIEDFIEELINVENNIPSNKLIEVYFRILHKGEKIYPISNSFNKHIIKYIENNSGNGPLSVWYRLVIEESNERLAYLYKNLKPEYAVKKEHFVDYPNKIQDTISLYTYLYFGKYFSYNYITELDYYKNSINAKKELHNLTYKEAEQIFKKYKQYYKLFKLFVPIKQFNEKNYNSEYTEFYKKLKQYKNDHDSLTNIINYYQQFFSGTKNKEIIYLQKIVDSIDNSPLTEFYSKKDIINEYLRNTETAKNRITLANSIIFMRIYNENKNKFEELKEEDIFNNSFKQFEELKNLENIDNFNKEFKDLIGHSFKGKENEIMKEINFIFSYFGLEDDYKIKNEIKLKIEEIIIPVPIPPVPPIPIETPPDPILIEVKDRSDECIYFYNKYKNEDEKENEIINKLTLFLELIFNFDNQKKIEKFEKEHFLFIIQKMLIADLISLNFNNSLINESKIYLFKEFYETYEVYKNTYNNDNLNLSKKLKNMDKLFYDKSKNEEYREILGGIKALFDSMKNENERNIKFSACFTNILEIEIGKNKTSIFSSRDKMDSFLDLIFTYLPDDFIPLIDLLSNDKISNLNDIINAEKLFNNNSNNILFNLLEKYNKTEKFKEHMLYYFESKINYILFEKEGNSAQVSEEKIKHIIKIVHLLEKQEKKDNNNNNNNTNNINLITLFYIAYLKVVLKKYINLINDENNSQNETLNAIFMNKNKTKFIESLSFYSLKLYYDKEGNFRDFVTASKNFIKFPQNINNQITSVDVTKKYYGFDYLLLPLKIEDAKKYNEIIKIILNSIKSQEELKNDLGILSDINKSNIDIFYCIISNLFLSHFSDQNYFDSSNYSILKKWFNDRLDQNKFESLNKCSKEILKMFINFDFTLFDYNKDLMVLLFALRLILNSLSLNENSFFFKLIINPKEKISSHQNFLKYFFDNNKNYENIESFRLFRFILLSHLLFSYKLNKIELEEIGKVTNIEIEEDNKIFKILNEEFDSIIKIIRYKGIKVKYIIIYMNIVFEEIQSIKEINNKKPEFQVKYLESILTTEFYLKKIKRYFNILKEIGINVNDDEFSKILFEDYDYCNNKENIQKYPYLNYYTTPNLCTIEDFKYQYISSMERHPIIDFIIKEKENEIINIMNSLPRINSFINKIYNKKVLSISKEEAENETIDDLDLNFEDDEIKQFNEDISKLIKDYEISNDSKLTEVLNIKDNKIYKLYDNIIKIYNDFLTKLKIYNNNKDFLLPFIVQDFSKEISLFKNPEEGLNELKKIISIFSKRNRLILDDKIDKLNIYNGDKIDYDFQLIENILEKKYFIDNNIFEQNQRTFIFSNNVFSGERNNVLTEIMEKYPQKPINNNDCFSEIESNENDVNIRIYHDLQFIIINLQYLSIYSKGEKISFEDISEMISKKYSYEINESLHFNDIHINNILSFYEKYEEKCFDYFKDILIPENLSEEKDETIKDYLDKLELIKLDVISKAAKKYLMRYCLGDYDKKENILKNMKIEKMFLKKDIWEEKVFVSAKFKDDCEKLKNLNNENDNYLDKYFLYNIIKNNERIIPDIPSDSPPDTPPDIPSDNSEDKEREEENECNDDNNNHKIENNNEMESSENKIETKKEENDDFLYNEEDKSENSRDMNESFEEKKDFDNNEE